MLNISEQFVSDYIEEDIDGLPAIYESIAKIGEYLLVKDYYKSKNTRINNWIKTEPNLYDLVISVFTTTLLHKSLTYQAICGMLNHKIKLPDVIDRVKTIAEILAVISKTGLINIKRNGSGENTTVTSGYELGVNIPVEDKHELSAYRPQRVIRNKDGIQGSMILGGSMNHHNDEICLDHINRVNAIPLSLNTKFLMEFEETPTFDLDTQDKIDQWKKFKQDSMHKYLTVIKEYGNRLFENHKFDTRGRCYVVGYHVSTQGVSYKKAMVELFNKELVRSKL